MRDGPIHDCIDNWHRCVRGHLEGGLDALLHPDCVFLSPIVFTPQRGREITKLYLTAAGATLAGSSPSSADDGISVDALLDEASGFRYVKQVLQGHHAVLEFETQIEGKYANGVDIITCDDDGLITEFKVMMRPLQAINAVHQQMITMLESLKGG
jgi:urease gamma subunit